MFQARFPVDFSCDLFFLYHKFVVRLKGNFRRYNKYFIPFFIFARCMGFVLWNTGGRKKGNVRGAREPIVGPWKMDSMVNHLTYVIPKENGNDFENTKSTNRKLNLTSWKTILHLVFLSNLSLFVWILTIWYELFDICKNNRECTALWTYSSIHSLLFFQVFFFVFFKKKDHPPNSKRRFQFPKNFYKNK